MDPEVSDLAAVGAMMVDSTNFHTLGERIRRVRKDSRLSQKAFSKLCGVSPLTLMRYETGCRGPDARFLIRLSENFNVNANWLLQCAGEIYNGMKECSGNGGALDAMAVGQLFQEFADFLKTRTGTNEQTGAAKSTRSRRLPRRAPGVLVVSPDPALRERIKTVLGLFSREIIESDSTSGAKLCLERFRINLVVLDNVFGEKESLDLTGFIREAGEAGVLMLNSTGKIDIRGKAGRLEYVDSRELDDEALLISAGRLISASAKIPC